MALANLLEPLDAPLTLCALGLAPGRLRVGFTRRLRTRSIVRHAHLYGLSCGWAGCGLRRRLGSLKGLTDDCGLPLQQSFNGLAQILQQMPAINNLLCLGRCSNGRLGVGRPAVSADEFDARMIVEPLLNGFGIAVGQEINHVAALKIHDDGAVSLAFEPGPIIDPDEAGRWRGVVLEPLDARSSVSGLVVMERRMVRREPGSPGCDRASATDYAAFPGVLSLEPS